jgi:glycosyltransferase involved in cell wall biosynthesis
LARFLPGETRVETLPAHHWKWRMSAAALSFAQRIEDDNLRPEWLITTDMLDLSRLKGLVPRHLSDTRTVLIMHENQLSYPQRASDRADLHLGLTNLYSAWCADVVWWNSCHHRDLFLEKAQALVRLFPQHTPKDLLQRIEDRSCVLGLPMDLDELRPLRRDETMGRTPGPLRVAWNHRMAYDKNPKRVFERLVRAHEAGQDFELHLFGPRHQPAPETLNTIKERIVDHGFLDRRPYLERLAQCDVVVADPDQEHFGLSLAESVQLGLWPIVPRRLCYPELLPKVLHQEVLFETEDEFDERFQACLLAPMRRAPACYEAFEAGLVIAQLCARLATG